MADTHAVRGPRPSSEMVDQAAGLTRQQRRILEQLHAHPTGMTVREISESLQLHTNTIRGHVEALERRRLVSVLTRQGEGPGRPSRLYVAQSAEPGRPTSHLATLIRASAAVMEPGGSFRQAREWGRRWAEAMVAEGSLPDGDSFEEVATALMAEMGFAPVSRDGVIRLYRCPLIAPDGSIPAEVCAIHQGLVEALAAETAARDGLRILPIVRPLDAPDSCSVLLEMERAQ